MTQPDSYNPEMVEKILKAVDEPPVAIFHTIEEYREWQDGIEPDSIETTHKDADMHIKDGKLCMTDSILSAEKLYAKLSLVRNTIAFCPWKKVEMDKKASELITTHDETVRNKALEEAAIISEMFPKASRQDLFKHITNTIRSLKTPSKECK